MTTKNKVLLLILVAIVAFELLVQIERFSRLNPHPFKKDDTISETSSKYNELRKTLKEIGYEGPLVIESFDPSFEELAGNCAIWRNFADTGEELAIEGLKNLKAIADAL